MFFNCSNANVEDLDNEAKLRKDVLNYLPRWRLNVKG